MRNATTLPTAFLEQHLLPWRDQFVCSKHCSSARKFASFSSLQDSNFRRCYSNLFEQIPRSAIFYSFQGETSRSDCGRCSSIGHRSSANTNRWHEVYGSRQWSGRRDERERGEEKTVAKCSNASHINMQFTRVRVASADNLCRRWFRAAQFALKIIYLIERRFGEGYSWPTRMIVRENSFPFDAQGGESEALSFFYCRVSGRNSAKY